MRAVLEVAGACLPRSKAVSTVVNAGRSSGTEARGSRFVLSKTMTSPWPLVAIEALNADFLSLFAWIDALLFGSFVRRGRLHVSPLSQESAA